MSTCRPPASRNFLSMISRASTRDLLETNFRLAPFLLNMLFLFQRVTLSSLVGKSIRFFFVLEDRILFSRIPAGFEYYLLALVMSGPAPRYFRRTTIRPHLPRRPALGFFECLSCSSQGFACPRILGVRGICSDLFRFVWNLPPSHPI
jgi:hypothetical protein